MYQYKDYKLLEQEKKKLIFKITQKYCRKRSTHKTFPHTNLRLTKTISQNKIFQKEKIPLR